MIKKSFSIFLLFLFSPALLLAGVNISAGVSSDIISIHEFVIENDTEKIKSRLDWNDLVIPSLTSQIAVICPDFEGLFSLTAGIPLKIGYLEDYDFLLKGNMPNMYSRHDIYVDKYYSFEVSLNKPFHIDHWGMILTPGVSCSYSNCKLSAQDGFYQYPAVGYWTGEEKKEPVSGTAAIYEISSLQPKLNVCFKTLSGISFQVGYTPYSFISTLDSHIIRQTQFFDKINGGKALDVKLSIKQDRTFYFMSYSGTFFNEGISSSTATGLVEKEYLIDDDVRSGFNQTSVSFGVGYQLF